jgi:hypothetical protein
MKMQILLLPIFGIGWKEEHSLKIFLGPILV